MLLKIETNVNKINSELKNLYKIYPELKEEKTEIKEILENSDKDIAKIYLEER
jgi:hypothetical protein